MSRFVVDEYGGTAGMVTLRDLTERIAGDVPDEAESEERELRWTTDGALVADGLVLLQDIEEELGVSFEEREVDTLGGLIFSLLGRRPVVGDEVVIAGHSFGVEEIDGLRVSRIRVKPVDPVSTGQVPENSR